MTVTTLGFGDITPLNPRVRFLVGIEAGLGVVLARLSLIALDRGARQQGHARVTKMIDHDCAGADQPI
jgi:hypothetical protein